MVLRATQKRQYTANEHQQLGMGMKTYEQILRVELKTAKKIVQKAKAELEIAEQHLKERIMLKKRHFKAIANENKLLRHAKEIKEKHDAKKKL